LKTRRSEGRVDSPQRAQRYTEGIISSGFGRVDREDHRGGYLKLSRKKVGLLVNFNVEHLKEGIKRMVND